MTESNAIANGLAGAGGGIIAQIITYPLQTVFTFFFSSSLVSIFGCVTNSIAILQVNTRQQTERILKRNKQSLLLPSSNSTTPPGTLLQIFQVQILLFFFITFGWFSSVYDVVFYYTCDHFSDHWK